MMKNRKAKKPASKKQQGALLLPSRYGLGTSPNPEKTSADFLDQFSSQHIFHHSSSRVRSIITSIIISIVIYLRENISKALQ